MKDIIPGAAFITLLISFLALDSEFWIQAIEVSAVCLVILLICAYLGVMNDGDDQEDCADA